MKNIFEYKAVKDVAPIKALISASRYDFIALNPKQRRFLRVVKIAKTGVILHYGDDKYYFFDWNRFNRMHKLVTKNGDVLSDVIGFDSVTSQLLTSKGKKYMCIEKNAVLQTYIKF